MMKLEVGMWKSEIRNSARRKTKDMWKKRTRNRIQQILPYALRLEPKASFFYTYYCKTYFQEV
jgi:hypothetical protein